MGHGLAAQAAATVEADGGGGAREHLSRVNAMALAELVDKDPKAIHLVSPQTSGGCVDPHSHIYCTATPNCKNSSLA